MQVTLEIPDDKYASFMEVVRNIRFVKVRKEEKLTPSQKEFVNDLKHSLEQVELHLQGKIQLQDAYEFLDELEKEEAISSK
ncbi:MAG: hypothetical protein ACOVO2_22310 [Emticicia sp.]|uniref:hypothetical protein n=1 Tax=Emticicia sp. TaxID=1930953 RepID=UPI003BA5DDA5